MAQRFLAPSVTFEGIIKQNGTISDDKHVITRGYAKTNLINGIHSDSANYLEVVADGGVNKLKVKPLTITDVTVNSTQADLAAFISNVYTGSNFQEGDIVFLTTPSPTEAYIHNGGSAGNANDWDQLNEGLSDAQIRSKFSASAGINYNSSSGAFTADQGEIRAFFSASSGIDFDASTGAFSADQTEIRGMLSAGGLLSYSGGQFSLQNSDVRGAISADGAAGNLATYNSGTGAILVDKTGVQGAISVSGGLLAKSGGEISLSNASVRGTLSADDDSGNLLTYNSSAGSFLVATTAVRGALSAGGLLSYSGGQFSIDTATVRAQVSAGGLLSYSGGQFSIDAATVQNQISVSGGLLAKSGGEIALTNANVRGTLSADPSANNLLTYSSGSGQMLVDKNKIRKVFASQTLSAGVALTLNHALGERIVHITAMDSDGKDVVVEKVYTDANNCAIKSSVGITVDIAVSI